MKYIRLKGIAGFVAVLTLITAFWWVAADWLVKTAVEEGGSAVLGARVELDDATVSFSPLGVTLTNLQVTNPDQPMRNLVQLGKVEAQLSLPKLLLGQVIVENLEADNVRLDTPRSRSGALPVQPEVMGEREESGADDNLDLSVVEEKLPSAKEILAREPLKTEAQIEQLKEEWNSRSQRLDQSLQALPTEESWQAYKQKFDEINSGKIKSLADLNRRREALKELKTALRQDKEALAQTREEIRQARSGLKAALTQLKQAPAEDLARIKQKYSFDSASLGNFSGLLFGDEAKAWIEQLQPWVERIQQIAETSEEEPPTPPRGQGRVIHFPASEPLPDMLIRKAKLGLVTEMGNIDVLLTDVTHQPQILGRPMRLLATGEALPRIDKLRIEGVFDHTQPGQGRDRLTWKAEGWRLEKVELSRSGALALMIARAQAEMSGELELYNGAPSGEVDIAFSHVTWQGEGKQSESLLKVLKGIDRFNVNTQISGKQLRSPRFVFKSDLDDKLKQSVTAQLKLRQRVLEKALRTQLDQKMKMALGPYEKRLTELDLKEREIENRLAAIEEMLKAKIDDSIENAREEMKEKLKNKLKELTF